MGHVVIKNDLGSVRRLKVRYPKDDVYLKDEDVKFGQEVEIPLDPNQNKINLEIELER